MWILECDGELLNHKRIWLRPGKSFLFGRTKETADYVINNKSVSRKHLLISVSPVKLGDSKRIHVRSELVIKDDSKHGTFLDGEKLLQASRTLLKKENRIKLGNFGLTFIITWKPVVLCFTFPERQQKSKGSEILEPYQARLETLDIKVGLEFIFDQTTHVVASKRNTAKGLQALIAGSYIVTDAFVTSVEHATKVSPASSSAELSTLSPLEEDFDAYWPQALNYLPEPGKEPAPRSVEFFAPDLTRRNLFEGYTFIISDSVQFDTLQPVVLSGGAKCVKFNLHIGKTPIDEFVTFVKSTSGEKWVENSVNSITGPGPVVVRFRRKDTDKTFDWAAQFIEMADAALGQRSIEQNEFLDAILANDAKRLRQPLREEILETDQGKEAIIISDINTGLNTSSAHASDAPFSAPKSPEQKLLAPSKKGIRRVVTQSRFRGFDDFDPAQLPKTRDSHITEAVADEQKINMQSEALFVEPSQSSQEPDSDSHYLQRKRKSEVYEDEQEEMFESLLPAAAAMKKRRIEETEEAIRTGKTSVNKMVTVNPSKTSDAVKNPVKPPIDILSIARTRREQLDQAAARESETLVSFNSGEENGHISDLRNLAIIEEMVIPLLADEGEPQSFLNSTRVETNSLRWEEGWNGRRNFKQFQPKRRVGDRESASASGSNSRVIVTLEEVKRKEFGIGESYWLPESSISSSRGNGGEKMEASKTSEPANQYTPRNRRNQGIEEADPGKVASRSGTPGGTTIVQDTQERSHEPNDGHGGKRSASSSWQAAPPPPSKKPKQSKMRVNSQEGDQSESDGDEMRFKFRRRGRGE